MRGKKTITHEIIFKNGYGKPMCWGRIVSKAGDKDSMFSFQCALL